MKKLLAGLGLLVTLGACSSLPAPIDEMVPEPTVGPVLRTWDEEDPGDPASGRYPALIVHYSADWAEDDADVACADRGGSLTDSATERWVCVVD